MKAVNVRNVMIGEGIPKICVPIVGINKRDIVDEARSFQSIPVDVVEWRADWFCDVFEPESVTEVLSGLREALNDIPFIFTFRTSKEGGEKAIEPNAYLELNKAVVKTGLADLIDVEVFSGEAVAGSIIECAHENGIAVIGSNHDFDKTPCKDEIIRRLRKMREMGVDIPKMAVMPKNKKDVLTLLEATAEISDSADYPVITMSMDGDGVISRLAGELFGCAMTFGAAKKASAPGQINVNDLYKILHILNDAQ